MTKELKLHQPINQFLRTVNTGDVEGFPASFAAHALVEDVGRAIRGREEIEKWSRHDIFGVHAHFDVVEVVEREGWTVLTVKIDGTFDRSGLPDPLLMDHSFRVAHGKIAELKVTFTPGRAAG